MWLGQSRWQKKKSEKKKEKSGNTVDTLHCQALIWYAHERPCIGYVYIIDATTPVGISGDESEPTSSTAVNKMAAKRLTCLLI